MLSRRALLHALPLSAGAWVLSSCKPATAPVDAGIATKTRLTLAVTADPPSLSPLLAEGAPAQELVALVTRELTLNDPTGALVPDLAVSIPSGADVDAGDGSALRVRWTLREDAFWEDGQPVVSDDFVLAWEVLSDPTQDVVGKGDVERVTLVRALSPKQFEVTFRGVEPGFARHRNHRLLPSHLLRPRLQNGPRILPLRADAMAQRGLSCGPFRLVEQQRGQRLRLERNPHAKPAPILDELLVQVMPSSAAMLLALQKGDVDAVLANGGLSPLEMQAAVAQAPQALALKKAPGLVWAHLDFRLDDPVLKDLRVRRAIAHAVDRAGILRALYGDLYDVAHTFFPPHHPLHAVVEPIAFDPAQAARLLDEAGYRGAAGGIRQGKDGAPLTLELAAASGQSDAMELLALVQGNLRAVGIDVSLSLSPFSVFFPEVAKKRKAKQLCFYAWVLDPSSTGRSMFHGQRIPSEENGWTGQNLAGYQNAAVDALLDRADGSLDLAVRQSALSEAQRLIAADLPALPFYFRPQVAVHNVRVQGIAPTGSITPTTWNAATWRVG